VFLSIARGVISVVRATSKEDQFLLAALPPVQRQIRLALGIVVALLVAFVVTAPFANTQLPRVDAFIPALETAIVINDLITSALLFAQFFIADRRAIFVLATGYLFTGLMAIPHMLTFPGAFAPTGLLGAGLQSTAWLYVFWKAGLPLAVIVYVLLSDATSEAGMSQHTPAAVIGWSVAAVIVIVCGLTWIAITADSLLPRLLLDSVHVGQVPILLTGALVLSLIAVALALLWVRRRSVLDLWLMVACCALMLEGVLALLINNRFELGWYAGRFYGLIATIFVLLVLLSETTVLHAHLARSVMRQRDEREARHIAIDALVASIVHEINQPLGAMVRNGNAGLRWLARATPDLDEVSAAFKRIVNDGHRVNEVITGIRSMFKKDIRGRAWLGINDLVREVLKMVELDLRIQGVSVVTELREGLPQLLADRGQLQQVFLNLIMNGIEAMRPITDRARVLRIRSDIIQEFTGVMVTVEDSGTGIDREDKDRIFEPFFTTKSAGTGVGLAICQSIIGSHGGTLQASVNSPYGTIFQVALRSDHL
jgi:signal transduction histidine kinase